MTRISMGTHTGTHVDSPSHLIPGGDSVTDLSLDALIGPCTVIQPNIDEDGAVGLHDIELDNISEDVKHLLIKSPNGSDVHLDSKAADWLVDHGIVLVGTDSLSVDAPASADLIVHRKLLEADIVIVENLELSDVTPGQYKLICFPLKIENADGAPVRAVLIQENDILTQSESWTEKARKLVEYHAEALDFVTRASAQLPTSQEDAYVVGRLWYEAELLDSIICASLDDMNRDLLNSDGVMDSTRGAAMRMSIVEEEYLSYECSWTLDWDERSGITVTLATDQVGGSFDVTVSGNLSGAKSSVRHPIEDSYLRNALVECYVVEVTT